MVELEIKQALWGGGLVQTNWKGCKLARVARPAAKRRGEADARATFGARADGEFPANVFETFAHIAQPIAAFVGSVHA